MRNTLRTTRFAPVLVAAALAAACASGGSTEAAPAAGGGAPAGETVLRVHNTHNSGEALIIYLVPSAGTLKRIGVVQPTEYLTVAHTDGPGRFSFRAERTNGSTFNSPAFNVVSGTYTWDISLGRVERGR